MNADRLMPARHFGAVAKLCHIPVPERTLVLTGALTPVTIVRTRYYRWDDVVAAMPEGTQNHPSDIARWTYAPVDLRPQRHGRERAR